MNKADLNEDIANELEATAAQHGIILAGRIPYDREVTRPQIARKAVVEVSDGPAARGIRQVWSVVEEQLRVCAALKRAAWCKSSTPGTSKSWLSNHE